MTACGNTESSAAPTPANSSVVLGESTEQVKLWTMIVHRTDFSNINGLRVCQNGDPCKGKTGI
ncbi:MAG: hypothetical protein ACLTCP_04440 [Ruminococcus bicirculans (ex Wegman et al. 2014)]